MRPPLAHPGEHRRQRPALEIDPGDGAVRQHPREVLGQAAAGDVSDRANLDGAAREQLAHGGDVDASGGEQSLAERRAVGERAFRALAFEQAADQRVAVRVRTGGVDAEHRVADADAAAVDDRRLLDHADGEACQIVVFPGVEPRHLRRLAAEQRRPGQLAAAGDAPDDRGGPFDVQPPARVVVEEPQRLRAGDEDVVDAHGDQVDADRVVAAELDGQPELGADAVRPGDEHRLAVAIEGQLEQAAEAADAAEHASASGACDERRDALDQGVAGGDVDAGVGIREPVGSVTRGSSADGPVGARRRTGGIAPDRGCTM